jgi:hypothetical protein
VKILIGILGDSLLLGSYAIAAEKVIADNEASKYVGESVAVKGIVAN